MRQKRRKTDTPCYTTAVTIPYACGPHGFGLYGLSQAGRTITPASNNPPPPAI